VAAGQSLGGNAQRGAPDGDATSNGCPMLTLSDQGRGPSSASPNFNTSKVIGSSPTPEARPRRYKWAKGRRRPGHEPAWQTDSRRLRRALKRPSPSCVASHSSSRRREHNTLSHQQPPEGLLVMQATLTSNGRGRWSILLVAAGHIDAANPGLAPSRFHQAGGRLGERPTRDRRGRRPIGTLQSA
jgi:hypothetical protein